MKVESNFLPYESKPDIQRLLRAMRRQEVDRVPNVEIVIEDKIVFFAVWQGSA